MRMMILEEMGLVGVAQKRAFSDEEGRTKKATYSEH